MGIGQYALIRVAIGLRKGMGLALALGLSAAAAAPCAAATAYVLEGQFGVCNGPMCANPGPTDYRITLAFENPVPGNNYLRNNPDFVDFSIVVAGLDWSESAYVTPVNTTATEWEAASVIKLGADLRPLPDWGWIMWRTELTNFGGPFYLQAGFNSLGSFQLSVNYSEKRCISQRCVYNDLRIIGTSIVPAQLTATTQVPVPGALPLMLVGVGALSAVARRSRRTTAAVAEAPRPQP